MESVQTSQINIHKQDKLCTNKCRHHTVLTHHGLHSNSQQLANKECWSVSNCIKCWNINKSHRQLFFNVHPIYHITWKRCLFNIQMDGQPKDTMPSAYCWYCWRRHEIQLNKQLQIQHHNQLVTYSTTRQQRWNNLVTRRWLAACVMYKNVPWHDNSKALHSVGSYISIVAGTSWYCNVLMSKNTYASFNTQPKYVQQNLKEKFTTSHRMNR